MAIIKSFKEIEHLIPEPDTRLYGSNITEAPAKYVLDDPLFAFITNKDRKQIVSVLRIMFMLVKRSDKYYLMISSYHGQSSFYTEYLTLPSDKEIKKTDWNFTVDEIGLRMDSNSYDKHTIYFGKLATDVKDIREALNKTKKNVLKLEAVLV